MRQLIEDFHSHIIEAIRIGRSFRATETERGFTNVVISGLGGSGIAGTIAAEILSDEAVIPIIANSGYGIPFFVDEQTLFIASSYSGNTEETVMATTLAAKAGAKVVVVTSGGELTKMAKANRWDLITIPGGHPPRACFGYSFPQVLLVLNAFGIISDAFINDLEILSGVLSESRDAIEKEATEIADSLMGKIPVIYAADGFGGVATRFRQQVNENSKMLCWHHVIPEMNHNELVGWRTRNNDLAVILFRNESDFSRIQARMEINKSTFADYTDTIIEVWSRGGTDLQRALYLIHIGDRISLILGEKKGIDITEVKVIDHLKGELSKLKD